MAKKTILFSSAMTALPSDVTAMGIYNLYSSFAWNYAGGGGPIAGSIRPRTRDRFLLLDNPTCNAGGGRAIQGSAPSTAMIDHGDGSITMAVDGAQLVWKNVQIAAGEMVNFDFVFLDGEWARGNPGNDFWQFEALQGGPAGKNVLEKVTQYHSGMAAPVSPIKNGRYTWSHRGFHFDNAFNGALRWTVGNGQRVVKGTATDGRAGLYPSALALDFISIT
jgi:hypothetical protein